MHYLCSKAGVADIRTIMSEMGSVVEAMVGRVKVDLGHDQIARALEAFNLEIWVGEEGKSLLDSLAVLVKALGLQKKVLRDVGKVAKVLKKLKDAATNNKLNLSNRQAWSWTLHASWRAHFLPPSFAFKHQEDFVQLICFYLSLKTNTTSIERNLGALLRQLQAHAGPQAENGETIADVLLVALDGPKHESELFEQRVSDTDAPANLIPTEVGRSCGKLWVQMYGRRFGYKYETRGGKTNPSLKRHKRSKGTFASIVRGQRSACNQLSTLDVEKVKPIVADIDLPLPPETSTSAKKALDGTRWASKAGSAEASRKRKKSAKELFEDHTTRKQASNLLSALSQFSSLV